MANALFIASCLLVTVASTAHCGSVWLTSLDLSKVTQGWGRPQVDKAITEAPMSISGTKFGRGLGTHSSMSLYIKVNGASRFRATVGVDDNANSDQSSVVFSVSGDGRVMWKSPVMKGGDNALNVDVDLKGIKMLLLSVGDAGDGFSFDHADWADARFDVSGASPQAVSPMDMGSDRPSALRVATSARLPYEKVLPGKITDYVALTADSPWSREYVLNPQMLTDDGFQSVQNCGKSCWGRKPWIMLRNSTTGEGVSALLAYSGNWSIEVKPSGDKTILRIDSVPSGLKPFVSVGGLPVPGVITAEFRGDWDNGAIPMARFIRSKLRRDMGPDWPLVQWNTWYADSGSPNEKSMLDAAKVAAGLGCEVFTIDAGWYGGKGDWQTLCGDWVPNKEKFPDGLEPVAREVRRLGMKFGLWVEIESASPQSPVGKEHPEWFLRDGDKLASERSVLDYGKPEVVAWAKAVIDRLMADYALDYIKMDFNTEPMVDSAKYPGGDPLYKHYQGLVDLWRYMRAKYPKLVVENCAGGSLRQDGLTAAFTDTHWVSDNVDNNYNLSAMFGATYIFPPEICSHWTCYPDSKTGSPLDLESQFTANMLGQLGLSGKIWEWDEDTRKAAAKQISVFKSVRPIIRNADVYHLTPQANPSAPSSVEAALYHDPKTGKALLFAFQGGADSLIFKTTLKGLRPNLTYLVRLPGGYGPSRTMKGSDLLKTGLELRFPHKGASAVIVIEPVAKRAG